MFRDKAVEIQAALGPVPPPVSRATVGMGTGWAEDQEDEGGRGRNGTVFGVKLGKV